MDVDSAIVEAGMEAARALITPQYQQQLDESRVHNERVAVAQLLTEISMQLTTTRTTTTTTTTTTFGGAPAAEECAMDGDGDGVGGGRWTAELDNRCTWAMCILSVASQPTPARPSAFDAFL